MTASTVREKDRRLFAKFTLEFAGHRKIAILSDAAFRALVEAILYSRDQKTDGLLASRYALARWGADVLAELCDNDDEKPSLIAVEKGWLIHDFADIQDTREEIDARSERNKRNGQRGGVAKAKRTARQVASESLSENVAETETETETEKRAKARPTRGRTQRPQPTFGEMSRGEPDPPKPGAPDDMAVRPATSTVAAVIVREVLPANRYAPAVLTDLRLRISALLHEGTPETHLREAVRLWNERDNGGPGLLPHLLADAARNLDPAGRQPPASRKVAAGLNLVAALADDTPPPPALER